jgi:hypothetical protein
MHAEAAQAVAGMLAALPAPRRVVELGARSVNGSIRDLLPADCAYTGVDLAAGDNVDVVADAAQWRPETPVDLVICSETLEHAVDPLAIVDNAARMLAPGGALIVTTATPPRAPHSGHDGGDLRPGEHYANIYPGDLGRWLAGRFPRVQIRTDLQLGDLYALARLEPPVGEALGSPASNGHTPTSAPPAPRILLVHPGARTSTSDVFDGLAPALGEAGATVLPYRLDDRLEHNAAWLNYRWRRAGRPVDARPGFAEVTYAAGRDVLEQALRRGADWVVAIGGILWHQETMKLLRRAGVRVALLLTESPYSDPEECALAGCANLVWTTERTSLQSAIARTNPHLRYLAHAAPRPPDPATFPDVLTHDVVFVGTAWKERIRLLEAVDWSGIDLGLYGIWKDLPRRSPLRPFLRAGEIPSLTTEALYRRAKVGLNLYRTHAGWTGDGAPVHAESLNPRAYALAAAGCVYVSQYRAEVAEVFGDLVPTFCTADELEAGVRSLLGDEATRERLRAALPLRVAPHTFRARADQVLADLAAYERAMGRGA